VIAYVSVGADDIAKAKRFYSAFLPALGYTLEEGPEGLSYELPAEQGTHPASPDFYVKPPFDGQAASAGNGTMVAFQAHSQRQVRDLHAAALSAGGSDEGQPGFRAAYGPRFYVGYCVIRRATRSRSFQTIPTNRDAMGKARPQRIPDRSGRTIRRRS
jgi:catechol 2,3-dioxygenase-like lactoylglutathione lyase family enzyme